MKSNHITALTLALGLLVPGAAPAADATKSGDSPKGSIKKCQDAQGRWHYGDRSAEECAKSKITEINKRGVEVREIAAPPTPEQIKEREQQKEQLQIQQAEDERRAQEQARRDRVLLASYGNEKEIIETRDRKLAEVDTQIRAGNDTLGALRAALTRYQQQAGSESRGGGKPSAATTANIARTEAQIAKQEGFIREKQEEQQTLRRQFQADLDRYRELKKRAAPPPAPRK